MLKVSTTHLSPDCASADAQHGTRDLGQLAPEAFAALLEKFCAIDALQNHEHEPLLTVQSPADKFFIRTGGGKLYLYNARDTTQPYAELTIFGILEALGVAPPPSGPTAEEFLANLPDAAPSRPRRTLLALTLLLAGLGLIIWSIDAYLHTEEKPAAPASTPVTDTASVARYRAQLAGAYATGNEPGDRRIILAADGGIIFRQLGADATPADESSDTCTIGLDNQLLCLVTTKSGAITVQPGGSLLYYGDTYYRASQ